MIGHADLHVHTNEGDGLDGFEAIFASVEKRGCLEVLAITEHDDIGTALRAREAWARRPRPFDFVPGVEVTTLEGHVIALFIERPVASLRRVEETLDAVHAQGGLCIVPHPLSWLTRSIGPGTLQRVAAARLRFDGMELATSSPASRRFSAKARRLNDALYHLPGVGASDAHFAEAAGTAWTEFEGHTAAELRLAIEQGKVRGVADRYPGVSAIGVRRTLALPIAGLGVTPRKLGWRRTVWSFVERYRRPVPARATLSNMSGRQ